MSISVEATGIRIVDVAAGTTVVISGAQPVSGFWNVEDKYTDDALPDALHKLSDLAGGQVHTGRPYQIRAKEVEVSLGGDYNDLIGKMSQANYVTSSVDEMNSEILLFSFLPRGLELLKDREMQIQEAEKAAQRRLSELATEDARRLTRHFRPERPNEKRKATVGKLHEILGESAESTLEDRLERLYVSKFCAANQGDGPDEYEITFFTKGVELGQEGPRPPQYVHRQITIDGGKVDLRNRANYDLLDARIEDVENVTQSYLHQLRSNPTKGQRRRLICELHRVMLLKGKELSRPLYDSICLRLGMQLPKDFWNSPPEQMPLPEEHWLLELGRRPQP